MVSRLEKKGMPTDSVEKAQRWRRRHLEWTRTKGVRMDASAVRSVAPQRAPATTRDAPAAVPRPAAEQHHRITLPAGGSGFEDFDWHHQDLELRIANRLGALAESDFEQYHAGLRLFIALTPRQDRLRLALPFAVWIQLYPPGLLDHLAPGWRDDEAARRALQANATADPMTEESQHVMISLACGELCWTPGPA
jgi:hypothetical protein